MFWKAKQVQVQAGSNATLRPDPEAEAELLEQQLSAEPSIRDALCVLPKRREPSHCWSFAAQCSAVLSNESGNNYTKRFANERHTVRATRAQLRFPFSPLIKRKAKPRSSEHSHSHGRDKGVHVVHYVEARLHVRLDVAQRCFGLDADDIRQKSHEESVRHLTRRSEHPGAYVCVCTSTVCRALHAAVFKVCSLENSMCTGEHDLYRLRHTRKALTYRMLADEGLSSRFVHQSVFLENA